MKYLYGSPKYVLPVPVMNPKNLQRIYFRVGKPIPTQHLKTQLQRYVAQPLLQQKEIERMSSSLRDMTKSAVLNGITELKAYRERDPNRMALKRTKRAARKRLHKLFHWFRVISQSWQFTNTWGKKTGAEGSVRRSRSLIGNGVNAGSKHGRNGVITVDKKSHL